MNARDKLWFQAARLFLRQGFGRNREISNHVCEHSENVAPPQQRARRVWDTSNQRRKRGEDARRRQVLVLIRLPGAVDPDAMETEFRGTRNVPPVG